MIDKGYSGVTFVEIAKHNTTLGELWVAWKRERATRERVRIVDIPPYKKVFGSGRGPHV